MEINSKRRYEIVGYEAVGANRYSPFEKTVSLDDILTGDLEIFYSIQDDLDKLLDMKFGDVIQLQAERSDSNSSMVVTRIE